MIKLVLIQFFWIIQSFQEKTILIIDLLRHAERPFQNNDSQKQDIGFTEQGFNSSIKYGQNLKKHFQDINQNDLQVFSSDRLRNVMTSIGIIKGIIDNKEIDYHQNIEVVDYEIEKYQMNVFNHENNFLFKPWYNVCKNLQQFTQIQLDKEMKSVQYYFDQNLKNYIQKNENLNNILQQQKSLQQSLWQIRDYVSSQSQLFQENFDDVFMQKLDLIHFFILQAQFFKEKDVEKLYLFNLIESILTQLDENLTNYSTNKSYKKYILYTMHDFHIRALSLLFGNFSLECLAKKMLQDEPDNLNDSNCIVSIPFLSGFQIRIVEQGNQFMVKIFFNQKQIKIWNINEIGILGFRRKFSSLLDKNYSYLCKYGKEIYYKKKNHRQAKVKYILTATLISLYIVYKRIMERRQKQKQEASKNKKKIEKQDNKIIEEKNEKKEIKGKEDDKNM